MESHYVRLDTSREYLHGDRNLSKIYRMFVAEHKGENMSSESNYRNVFRTMNLSIHRPKKDKSSLCEMYRQGDEATKEKLEDKYKKHIKEKT